MVIVFSDDNTWMCVKRYAAAEQKFVVPTNATGASGVQLPFICACQDAAGGVYDPTVAGSSGWQDGDFMPETDELDAQITSICRLWEMKDVCYL